MRRAGAPPSLAMRGAHVAASIAGLDEHGRVNGVELLSPVVSLAEPLPTVERGGPSDTSWSVGRLTVRHGSFTMAPSGSVPGVAFRVTGELRDLGTGRDEAELPQRVTLRDVRVTVGGAPALAVDAARAEFRVAGLLARRIDTLRLGAPAVTVPETLPAFETPGGGAPALGWTIGRLVTHDGSVKMSPAGNVPGVTARFAFDLRELGDDPERAARPHHVRVRDLHARYAKHPASLVLDRAGVIFTVAGLRDRRQLALLRVDGGTLVLDQALRDHLTSRPSDVRLAAPNRRWRVAVVDVARLGFGSPSSARGSPT